MKQFVDIAMNSCSGETIHSRRFQVFRPIGAFMHGANDHTLIGYSSAVHTAFYSCGSFIGLLIGGRPARKISCMYLGIAVS